MTRSREFLSTVLYGLAVITFCIGIAQDAKEQTAKASVSELQAVFLILMSKKVGRETPEERKERAA